MLNLVLSRVNALDWLTDERWIVFGYNGGFGQYLEHCYFAPGTAKNAEFEVMVALVVVEGRAGISAFFRIRDSVENRDSLRAALAEFNDKRLLSLAELDDGIEALRERIREKVVPKLR
ncbi:MAG: hypothetical protein NWF04_01450 [Candidatus Bathyarchaeota archaeon]|nr:hypothetical protein [Candidatus Bathyarchaeota archaeon]